MFTYVLPRSIASRVISTHTPSIAFRDLPPNTARICYADERALFISAQLSSDAAKACERFGY